MRRSHGALWDGRADAYAATRVLSDVDRATCRLLGDMKRDAVLELGCGPATFARHLLDSCPDVRTYVGLDISARFVELAARGLAPGGSRDVRVQRVRRLSEAAGLLPAASMDVVVAMAVLHHLAPRSLRATLEAIGRVLAPGGYLVVVEDWAFEPSADWHDGACRLRRRLMEHDGIREYHRREAEWAGLFARHGYALDRLERAERPLDLDRFRVLSDDDSRRCLRVLEDLPPAERRLPMSIFRLRRNDERRRRGPRP